MPWRAPRYIPLTVSWRSAPHGSIREVCHGACHGARLGVPMDHGTDHGSVRGVVHGSQHGKQWQTPWLHSWTTAVTHGLFLRGARGSPHVEPWDCPCYAPWGIQAMPIVGNMRVRRIEISTACCCCCRNPGNSSKVLRGTSVHHVSCKTRYPA